MCIRSLATLNFLAATLLLLLPAEGLTQTIQKKITHPPKVGEEAPDFELRTLADEKIVLHELTEESPVVVIVLRGWPGYQCGICRKQVADLLSKQQEFAERGVQVVMIYPGPADLLAEHAKEFQGKKVFPKPFVYLTDPDYKFTNAWNLRWEAERETAYPATYIVGEGNVVQFAEVSEGHGGRVSAADVLEELDK